MTREQWLTPSAEEAAAFDERSLDDHDASWDAGLDEEELDYTDTITYQHSRRYVY